MRDSNKYERYTLQHVTHTPRFSHCWCLSALCLMQALGCVLCYAGAEQGASGSSEGL
jgi:hypothetical protein